jgi:hypothetical protein
VRYQAALRPDMTSRIDSKVLSNFMTTANRDFWPRPCQTVQKSLSPHVDRARVRFW